MKSFSVVLGLLALSFIPLTGQVEGRYRFLICEDACTPWDTVGALASGEIVLFPDSGFAAAIPDTVLAELRRGSRSLLLRNPDFNGCFRIPQRVESVGGHEFFPGIIRNGLTRWSIQEGELNFSLHRSVDGEFRVIGTFSNGWIEGTGLQRHGPDPTPPPRAFLAERIGPPDPDFCTVDTSFER